MINITCNQIVSWYGQYHHAPWSPSLCLHEVVTPTITSTSMANAFSNKVSNLHGVIQWHAGHTKNYFTLLLNALAIEVEVVVGVTTSWRHDDGDHDDGDHGFMPVTKMIMAPRRWRSKEQYDIGHIMSLFDCMWCLSCFTSYLLRTTVA